MRKLFASIIAIVLALSPMPASAKGGGGFGLGLVAGAIIASSSQPTGQSTVLGEVLYQLPRADERIKDPLDLKVAISSYTYGAFADGTVRDHFQEVLHPKDKKDTVLIRATLVPGTDASELRYQFVFTASSNVRSLEELPKQDEATK